MPHEIAGIVGCDPREAMELLLFLFSKYLAEGYLLIYHRDHPATPIMAVNIYQGFPRLPLFCRQCDEEIENRAELLYDFMFHIRPGLEFVSEYDAIH
jgi:hypothetical protein